MTFFNLKSKKWYVAVGWKGHGGQTGLGLSILCPSSRGSLEGKRGQKSYKALLEDPMLRFSGLYQESCSDLYVTCQVFAEGKPLALPVRTSYKAFSTRWK